MKGPPNRVLIADGDVAFDATVMLPDLLLPNLNGTSSGAPAPLADSGASAGGLGADAVDEIHPSPLPGTDDNSSLSGPPPAAAPYVFGSKDASFSFIDSANSVFDGATSQSEVELHDTGSGITNVADLSAQPAGADASFVAVVSSISLPSMPSPSPSSPNPDVAQFAVLDADATAPSQAAEGFAHDQPGHTEAAAMTPVVVASLANPLLGVIAESAVGSSGATGEQVQQAIDENGLGVNGSGIRVGVLSDSFNDLGGAATDEADGALPPGADIDVIKDLASGGTDEGRAMMQIIHDIAPGASLAFYTAFDSEQDFANGILALAAAGCKVIVDDVSYSDEPFFQNGVVAQAIQAVEAEGVTYVTAAGNDASNAYQAAWVPMSGTVGGYHLTDAEDFGGSILQAVTINTEGTGYAVPLMLQWNQAYGEATSDLEILVFNGNAQLIGTATNASSGEPTNPYAEYDFTQSGTYYVAVENLSGSNPGLIKEITEGDGLPATISNSNVGSVFGHAMTPGAITAGAVSVADTPAFGANPAVSETFSSSGQGTELLFANNGAPLSTPDQLSPVVVSGVDNVHTSVRGDLSDFYGTSAASASLAGVAALMLSADPALTPAQVEQIMEETALPMTDPAVAGSGLVQVDPAVAQAVTMVVPLVITATDQTVGYGQSIPITDVYSVTGSGIVDYQIWFSAANQGAPALGSVTENGAAIPLNQPVTETSLSGLDYMGGATTGTDEIWLRAFNGIWSSWIQADISDPGAPMPAAADVTANELSVASGQSVALSQIYSVISSGITEYQVWFRAFRGLTESEGRFP